MYPSPSLRQNSLAWLQSLPALTAAALDETVRTGKLLPIYMTRGIAIIGSRTVSRDLCMRQPTDEFGAGHTQDYL